MLRAAGATPRVMVGSGSLTPRPPLPRSAGEGERTSDAVQSARQVALDLVAAQTHEAQATVLENGLPHLVQILASCVRRAVDLDDQTCRRREEVRHEAVDWLLTLETNAIESPVAQRLPENPLGTHRLSPQSPRHPHRTP